MYKNSTGRVIFARNGEGRGDDHHLNSFRLFHADAMVEYYSGYADPQFINSQQRYILLPNHVCQYLMCSNFNARRETTKFFNRLRLGALWVGLEFGGLISKPFWPAINLISAIILNAGYSLRETFKHAHFLPTASHIPVSDFFSSNE